jgi:hypothetical protein
MEVWIFTGRVLQWPTGQPLDVKWNVSLEDQVEATYQGGVDYSDLVKGGNVLGNNFQLIL